MSRYYRFEEAKKLCEYFNKFVDTLKRDWEQTTSVDKYPWLDPEDERNMTDREILEKYVDLKKLMFKCRRESKGNGYVV